MNQLMETINRVERNLINICRGKQTELAFSYRNDRRFIKKDTDLTEKLPNFLLNCKSTTEFISHINLYYDTEEEQLKAIERGFEDLKAYLEAKTDEAKVKNDSDKKIDEDFIFDDDLFDLDEVLKDRDFLEKIHNNYEIIDFKENKEQVAQYQEDNDQNRFEAIVLSNQGLVCKIASRYLGHSSMTYDDLISYGNIGLFEAIKKFDISHNTEFSTYATFWIKQKITRAIYDEGHIIRFPVHLEEQLRKLRQKENQIIKEHNLDIDLFTLQKQICQELEIPTEKYEDLKRIEWQFRGNASLDMLVKEEGNTSLIELVSPDSLWDYSYKHNETDKTVEEVLHSKFLLEELNDILLDRLTDRETEIICRRYGLNRTKAETLEEIGADMGVTRERIRQLEARALKKLKTSRVTKRIRDYLYEVAN